MTNVLFEPKKIRNVTIPNRLAVTSMVGNFCDPQGRAGDQFVKYFEAKARGGYGLVMSEALVVSEDGKGFVAEGGIWDDSQIEGLARMTRAVHQYESNTFAQLIHAGRQTLQKWNNGHRPIAPSPLACPVRKEVPREMTREDIARVIADFANAARRAKEAGFDGVEIHAGHGYLVAQFLSSYANKRVDAYGGPLAGRMKFLLDIVCAVREAVGDIPVGVRISAEEHMPGGRNIEDTKAIAVALERAGVDYLNVSNGTYGDGGTTPPMHGPHAWKVNNAEQVKKVVAIPVITAARINDPLLAESVLLSGKADFVAMTRASLAQPDLPNLAKKGEPSRLCIGCMQGCYDRMQSGEPITCLVNPNCGYEYLDDLSRAKMPKRVVVVGGGPAGIEAARAAALTGHSVALYEANDYLGGNFTLAAYAPGKGEFTCYPAWAAGELARLGVEVRMGERATAEAIRAQNPDLVVLATGGTPIRPRIPGIDGANVATASQVMRGEAVCGDRVVVCGGGQVGAETAVFLGIGGKKVTMIEQLPTIANGESPAVLPFLMGQIAAYKVNVKTECKITGITNDGVMYEENGKENTAPCDTVVLAFGFRPDGRLASELAGFSGKIIAVGDAVDVKNALVATRDGFAKTLEALRG